MKPKTFVAIASIFSVLVAGLIIIVGYSRRAMLPIYLLIFLLTMITTGLYFTRNLFGDKLFGASVILIIIAISLSFYVSSLKTYYDVMNDYGNLDTNSDINLMQSENIYYSEYADYLNQRIIEFQKQSKIMRDNLTELKRLKTEQAQQASIVTNDSGKKPLISIPETSYITYYPQEYEGYEDD